MSASVTEIARLFNAEAIKGSNHPESIYPGYTGLVVTEGAIRSMTWGFPLQRKGKSGQPLKPKPVNNARTDRLDSFFWRSSFEKRRCLIPVSAFAEAEGPRGAMTRTWFTNPNQPLFACAGVWRDSDEFGPAYSMIMTDASEQVAPVHNRMPVILEPADFDQWSEGSANEARRLCTPYFDELHVDRTAELWFRSKSP